MTMATNQTTDRELTRSEPQEGVKAATNPQSRSYCAGQRCGHKGGNSHNSTTNHVIHCDGKSREFPTVFSGKVLRKKPGNLLDRTQTLACRRRYSKIAA